jgi:hypothetical protein
MAWGMIAFIFAIIELDIILTEYLREYYSRGVDTSGDPFHAPTNTWGGAMVSRGPASFDAYRGTNLEAYRGTNLEAYRGTNLEAYRGTTIAYIQARH